MSDMIKVIADATEFQAGLDRATALLSEVLELPSEVIERLLHSLDLAPEIDRMESHTAEGTREIVVRFKLPNGFLELLPAIAVNGIEVSRYIVNTSAV